jgi:hypothetical protein
MAMYRALASVSEIKIWLLLGFLKEGMPFKLEIIFRP